MGVKISTVGTKLPQTAHSRPIFHLPVPLRKIRGQRSSYAQNLNIVFHIIWKTHFSDPEGS